MWGLFVVCLLSAVCLTSGCEPNAACPQCVAGVCRFMVGFDGETKCTPTDSPLPPGRWLKITRNLARCPLMTAPNSTTTTANKPNTISTTKSTTKSLIKFTTTTTTTTTSIPKITKIPKIITTTTTTAEPLPNPIPNSYFNSSSIPSPSPSSDQNQNPNPNSRRSSNPNLNSRPSLRPSPTPTPTATPVPNSGVEVSTSSSTWLYIWIGIGIFIGFCLAAWVVLCFLHRSYHLELQLLHLPVLSGGKVSGLEMDSEFGSSSNQFSVQGRGADDAEGRMESGITPIQPSTSVDEHSGVSSEYGVLSAVSEPTSSVEAHSGPVPATDLDGIRSRSGSAFAVLPVPAIVEWEIGRTRSRLT